MTVEEGNRLIALFMGAVPFEDGYKASREKCSIAHMIDNALREEVKFDTSWDWLMPVVEKIENLKDEHGSYLFSFDIGRDWCMIIHNDFTQRPIAVTSLDGDKIGSVFETTVKFINWYNANIKQIQ